jgi:hypothetical protein
LVVGVRVHAQGVKAGVLHGRLPIITTDYYAFVVNVAIVAVEMQGARDGNHGRT